MSFTTTDARLQALADFFESLAPSDLDRIGDFYAIDARFKDPFNDVQGLPAIRAIFAHMFVALHEPRFVVTGGLAQGDEAFLTWDFVFRFKRFNSHTVQTVRGATHLRFAPDGRALLHRDYWDAAEELYEKLPVVGGLMRWLKRRANS
jgi:ketosteroid isomerase-like protein